MSEMSLSDIRMWEPETGDAGDANPKANELRGRVNAGSVMFGGF